MMTDLRETQDVGVGEESVDGGGGGEEQRGGKTRTMGVLFAPVRHGLDADFRLTQHSDHKG